jgi:cytochrome bd-type quinol oxidase subunit 2
VAAVLSALATVACCLPFGIAGVLAAVGLSVPLERARPWLLALASLLLLASLVQMVRLRRQCRTCGWWSMTLWCISCVLVFMVSFFPQVVTGLFVRLP